MSMRKTGLIIVTALATIFVAGFRGCGGSARQHPAASVGGSQSQSGYYDYGVKSRIAPRVLKAKAKQGVKVIDQQLEKEADTWS